MATPLRSLRYPYSPTALPYGLGDLAPYIGHDVLDVHYNGVYRASVGYLNATLEAFPFLQGWTLEQLMLYDIPDIPVVFQNIVRQHAGSVFNHNLYFRSMTLPDSTEPSGLLLDAIIDRYQTLGEFEDIFAQAAVSLFGSGGVWLNAQQNGQLHIAVSRDYNSPLRNAIMPLFALDMWEHAYFAQYAIELRQYVASWFHLLDWQRANERYTESFNIIGSFDV